MERWEGVGWRDGRVWGGEVGGCGVERWEGVGWRDGRVWALLYSSRSAGRPSVLVLMWSVRS